MPTVKIDPGQIVVERDMTIAQWCAKRNFKRGKFYDLKKQGRAPVVLNGRIPQKEDRAWEKRERKRANSAAAKREAERRSAQARAAGLKAAESAFHISKRGRQS